MNRRDAMKMLSLSFAGAAAVPVLNGSAAEKDISSVPYAEIKNHNGTPTFFLNGSPANYSGIWAFGPDNPDWGKDSTTKVLASTTNTHIYAFESGARGAAPQWCGPGEGYSGDFDFSKVKSTFERIIDVDPRACFHLRVNLEMVTDWWHLAYPDECEVTSLGWQPRQSYASKVWRNQAIDFLKSFATHIESIGMADRVIAYQVGAGHTGEWVKRRSSMAAPCGDYSEPMRIQFKEYLRKKYNNDVSALRMAWDNSEISFDTVDVPSAGEQLQAKNYIFRDPQSERNVIDYFQCLADLCSGLIIDYCKTVKEETGGKCLAGAFYGYITELSWNSGFFAEWPERWRESDYTTTQRSGHLGLDRIFDSDYVDFLVSPYSYGFRGIGGESPSMIPAESARLHGKYIIVEDDIRLHEDTYHAQYGQAKNLEESITLLKRNFNQYVTHGQGYWRPATDKKELLPLLKQLNEIGDFALKTDRTPTAEIAVLLDDESFYYETSKNNLDIPLIFRQKLEGLIRFGAVFNTYLLDDFIEGLVPPHKLYIFLNAFRLGGERREKLKRELHRDNRVAVWLYAPGYINDDLSMDNMTDLTGFTFSMSKQPWGVSMHIVNFNHPITTGIPQDLFWGTNSLLSPVFYIEDHEAIELGQVVHAQGRCVTGMGIKEFPEWKSIFISAPNVPSPVLRGLARFSGAHLYNENGDVMNATKNLLGVHTVSGGKRIFKLPEKVREVYDLYNNKSVATNTDRFDITLSPKSTSLYYTGDAKLLAEYNNI
ncbi:hypothetical protein ACFL6H_08080 [Candidatus Latescibacterota bacterium]